MVAPPNVARQGGGADGGSGDGGVAPGEEEAEVVESEEAWLSSLGKQVRGRTNDSGGTAAESVAMCVA